MKNNFWTNLGRSSAAIVLLLTIFSTSSMLALAATPDQRLRGELTVIGTSADSDAAKVTVDGEHAFSGRTVFSSSTITTPATAGAIISLGSAGRLELSPNSSFNLNFTDKTISGTLAAGRVKVFNSAGVETKIQTKDETVYADANQSNFFAVDVESGVTKAFAETGAVSLSNGKELSQQDTSGGSGSGISSANVAVPLAIFSGIVAIAVIYVVTQDDDDDLVVSPVR